MQNKWYSIKDGWRPADLCCVLVCSENGCLGRGYYRSFWYRPEDDTVCGSDMDISAMDEFDSFMVHEEWQNVANPFEFSGIIRVDSRWLECKAKLRGEIYNSGLYSSGRSHSLREKNSKSVTGISGVTDPKMMKRILEVVFAEGATSGVTVDIT